MAAEREKCTIMLSSLLQSRTDDRKRSYPFRLTKEDCVVPFSGIVDPEHLALLTAAVDDYCREAGIDPVGPQRDEVARFVVTLFGHGAATAEELKAALRVRLEPKFKRHR